MPDGDGGVEDGLYNEGVAGGGWPRVVHQSETVREGGQIQHSGEAEPGHPVGG